MRTEGGKKSEHFIESSFCSPWTRHPPALPMWLLFHRYARTRGKSGAVLIINFPSHLLQNLVEGINSLPHMNMQTWRKASRAPPHMTWRCCRMNRQPPIKHLISLRSAVIDSYICIACTFLPFFCFAAIFFAFGKAREGSHAGSKRHAKCQKKPLGQLSDTLVQDSLPDLLKTPNCHVTTVMQARCINLPLMQLL